MLEPLSMAHSTGMFALWQQDLVQEYSGPVHDEFGETIHLPATNVVDSDRLIRFWLSAAASGWGFRWAVLLKEEQNLFVGHIGFNSLAAQSEIAYHLNPGYWGKGIMYEAAQSAIQWRKRQGASALEAYIEPMNTKSISLAKRLGMVATGELSDGAERYLMPL